MRFEGEILSPPKLRFSYALRSRIDDNPFRGIRRYGPYDGGQLPISRVNCGIIFPSRYSDVKETIKTGMLEGEGFFKGFKSLFRIPLDFTFEREYANSLELRRALRNIPRDCDFVFVILPQYNVDEYSFVKKELLLNGILNQIVTGDKIRKRKSDGSLVWTLTNIALSMYAKLGGIPWLIDARKDRKELIIGVSRVQDTSGKYVAGFVTLFSQFGDYLFLESRSPVVEWDKYLEGLRELIVDAFIEYLGNEGEPDVLILHFHKNPGRKEIEAVTTALNELKIDIPYALVHLNEYSNYRLFDTAMSNFVPERGLKVNLSPIQALLLVDGNINGKRNRMGTPHPLEIRLDKRSTIERNEFPYLVKQVYDFSYVNWRGFNARSSPVTVNYPRLIAKLVLTVGPSNWNNVLANGRLKDKAWFL